MVSSAFNKLAFFLLEREWVSIFLSAHKKNIQYREKIW